MEDNSKSQKLIDLRVVFRNVWAHRRKFIKVWIWTLVLSCIWVFPQPRYYKCEVKLAPEASGADMGGLASIASSFGFNIGGMAGGTDAIYPVLYPDLFTSNDFIVSLFDIEVHTIDGEYSGDYYTYLKKHQKKNWLTWPFNEAIKWVKKLFVSDDDPNAVPGNGNGKLDPFRLSRKDFNLVEKVQGKIKCTIDKKTDVTTLLVEDQDPLVCAQLADTVKCRLQDFIIQYRTSKARMDMDYYQSLTDTALIEYRHAAEVYSRYAEAHQNIALKSYQVEADRLENEMSAKLTTYNAFYAQLQAMRAKVQERTPAFTTLKAASVPVKPAGPKRMIFVAAMLMLATIITVMYVNRDEIWGNNGQQ
ncbi:MAG: chain-length determining protein [Bacteroidales bacterium]|nr:chain-length determining protein [Candidatus Liminaster caballi]